MSPKRDSSLKIRGLPQDTTYWSHYNFEPVEALADDECTHNQLSQLRKLILCLQHNAS
jgi:hypothetical protein